MRLSWIKNVVLVGLIISLTIGCSHKSSSQGDAKLNVASETNGKREIQGAWATSDTANISFRVKGDSLYFFEDPNPVFFDIRKDSFIYYLSGEKYFNRIIKLDSDSIVFIENGETIRLSKRK